MIKDFLYKHLDSIINAFGIIPTLVTVITVIMEFVIDCINNEISASKKIRRKTRKKIIRIVQIIFLLFALFGYIELAKLKSNLVLMPQIEGMIYSDAIQTLNENNISYINKNVKNPQDWKVSKQSIEINKVINKNTKVNFSIEKIDNINENLGDVNNDGITDIYDARIINDELNKEKNIKKELYPNADVNQDGIITYEDVRIIHEYYTYLGSGTKKITINIEEYYINKYNKEEDGDNY